MNKQSTTFSLKKCQVNLCNVSPECLAEQSAKCVSPKFLVGVYSVASHLESHVLAVVAAAIVNKGDRGIIRKNYAYAFQSRLSKTKRRLECAVGARADFSGLVSASASRCRTLPHGAVSQSDIFRAN